MVRVNPGEARPPTSIEQGLCSSQKVLSNTWKRSKHEALKFDAYKFF